MAVAEALPGAGEQLAQVAIGHADALVAAFYVAPVPLRSEAECDKTLVWQHLRRRRPHCPGILFLRLPVAASVQRILIQLAQCQRLPLP